MSIRSGKLAVRLHNWRTIPERVAARFLRKRGWVAFYLDPQARVCTKDTCWLKLYQEQMK